MNKTRKPADFREDVGKLLLDLGKLVFGGILLFIALPLAIMGYVSHWRVKQSEKQA